METKKTEENNCNKNITTEDGYSWVLMIDSFDASLTCIFNKPMEMETENTSLLVDLKKAA